MEGKSEFDGVWRQMLLKRVFENERTKCLQFGCLEGDFTSGSFSTVQIKLFIFLFVFFFTCPKKECSMGWGQNGQMDSTH